MLLRVEILKAIYLLCFILSPRNIRYVVVLHCINSLLCCTFFFFFNSSILHKIKKYGWVFKIFESQFPTKKSKLPFYWWSDISICISAVKNYCHVTHFPNVCDTFQGLFNSFRALDDVGYLEVKGKNIVQICVCDEPLNWWCKIEVEMRFFF